MEKPSELYLGLMTGTSLDGVDSAAVRFTGNTCELLATHEHPFPAKLRERLLALINQPDNVTLDELGGVDRELGMLYAQAVKVLLDTAGLQANAVDAVGCHGQTIRHCPDSSPPFTLQIGDGATLANLSQITTVNDFRSADIALGGQGAPLAPAFHQWLVGDRDATATVINIGGIANISVLQPDAALTGFDTGPGNTLMDQWSTANRGETFDANGDWAASGTVIPKLLQALLEDEYFKLTPPKSTGREYFNMIWLQQHLDAVGGPSKPADVQATLAELTAKTIADDVMRCAPGARIWLCGGGAFNNFLWQRLSAHLPDAQIQTTDALGISPAWIEAAAFAWLARARINGEAAGSTGVTGARAAGILGAVHKPAHF